MMKSLVVLSVAALAAWVAAGEPHTFRYESEEELEAVYLAGTFNNWSSQDLPMVYSEEDDEWSLTIELEPGKHLYKFVLNGEEWVTDPNSWKDEEDGNGYINSVLIIWPEGYERSAKVGDGEVTEEAIMHLQEIPLFNYDRGNLYLTLQVRPEDVSRVAVTFGDGEDIEMDQVTADELYARYSAVIPWDRVTPLEYAFVLEDGDQTWNFGDAGLKAGEPSDNWFRLSPETFEPFQPPAWVESTVVYQIFPDRFLNADPGNDPEDVQPWDAEPTWFNWFGGDFAGVEAGAEYLDNLGIDAIYFNPIFQGPSNHRYEATDYRLIDERLGTNDQFKELTEKLDEKDIAVILDGVFNHTATDFPPFADVVEKGRDSEYVDWFFIKHFPVEPGNPDHYECWWGFPSMPKVNLENPEARDYMLSLLDYWHENATIKGWRLDVANEVSMEFWREFRKHLKALDEDYWIVGEVWGDGSPWLKGDQWDSVMNYRFRFATLDLLASQTASPTQYLNNLMRTYNDYGPQVSRNMMNLLGSHDTERFMTLVQGDVDRAKLGATLQFAWVGAPSIYYGDELGMEGGGDPDNRRGMRWDLVDESNEVLLHYRKLIALRDSSRALQSGDPLILQADDQSGTFAYARTLQDDFALLAANSTDETQTITLNLSELKQLGLGSGAVSCILSDLSIATLEDELTLTLDPYEAVVLVPDQVASRVTLLPVSSPVAHRPVPVSAGSIVQNNHHRR